MVLERLAKTAERKFGFPPLSKLADTLEKFPDAKQLKEINELLDKIERVCKTAPDLDKVVSLFTLLQSLSPEEWKRADKILARIERILAKTPQEVLALLTELTGERDESP